MKKPISAPPPPPIRGAAPRPAVPPPPSMARPVVQPFASFQNRPVAGRPVADNKPARGDELVALGADTFRARSADRGLLTRPNGTYNFVRTEGTRRIDQRTLISAKSGHVQLSGGSPVLYAGTVHFKSGALDWWSNYSGHYQPIAAFREQAQLPADKFVPWQQLQMGGIAMQRGLFRDRRAPGAPEAAKPAPAKDAGKKDAVKKDGPSDGKKEPARGKQ